jgi:hypothetical protein
MLDLQPGVDQSKHNAQIFCLEDVKKKKEKSKQNRRFAPYLISGDSFFGFGLAVIF